MIHTLDGIQSIDIGLALRAVEVICRSYAVCKGCPLNNFCSVYLRIDPWAWDDADIPESLTVAINRFKER